MVWSICLTSKALKQVRILPPKLQGKFKTLGSEIRAFGPVRGNWPNYSKLSTNEHHCHLSYRYVACWRELTTEAQEIEVYYVGTREKAPY